MSLLCKLKKLVHKGELEEKDLERIVIVPKDATNGDVIKAVFPDEVFEEYASWVEIKSTNKGTYTFCPKWWWNSPYRKEQE